MKVVAIITSRWESTRLPGKALVDICGEPMLQRIVDTAGQSAWVDEVVIATTPSSQPIIDYCKENNISHYIGDEEDILGRLYETAKQFNANLIVRLWGDAPLVETYQIDSAIKYARLLEPTDYTSLSSNNGVVAVMSFALLKSANTELTDKESRLWFHKYLDNQKLTVDTKEDLDGVCKVWVMSKR